MKIKEMIRQALLEDLGEAGDITVKALIDYGIKAEAMLVAKEGGVLCGADIFTRTFQTLDREVEVRFKKKEGQRFEAGEQLATIYGRAASILSAERTALNFLQTLSGIATQTRTLVELLYERGSTIKILDTRKTLPLWRALEKYAVRIGGGFNHRMGLYDMILIKENHLAFHQSIYEAVRRAKDFSHLYKVEVEVKNLDELRSVLSAKPDIVMLDNFSIEELKEAIRIVRKEAPEIKIEYSGSVDESTLNEIAPLDIDFVSIGALTKNIRAIDFSILFAK